MNTPTLSSYSNSLAPRIAVGVVALCALVGLVLWLHGIGLWKDQTHPGGRAAPAGLAELPAKPDDLASQKLEPLAPDDARKINAATPFAEFRPLPAHPFRFAGSAADRARAVDCLALAAMAEAGGGDAGQRSVIQVILNRVRHPAFAKTVCGVVFQGSERVTGCQFTFTCDGALARRYSDAAWAAARSRAGAALDGQIFAPVGAATHYHTDWVHPVWSRKLDKIARVDTHLFFRWPGYWGSRDAGRFTYRGGEPAMSKISWLPAHAAGAIAEAAPADETPSAPIGLPERKVGETVGIGKIAVGHPDGGAYLVHLSSVNNTAAALSVGRRLCGGRGYCRVLGWTDRRAIPKGFPVPPAARAKLSFSYVLDATNAEYIYYDCKAFAGVPRESCMPPSGP